MPPRRQRTSLSRLEGEGDEAKTASTLSVKPVQKRRAQMAVETAGGGKKGAGGGGEAGKSSNEIFVKMEPHVLDCTICSEPLNPHIYQCEVGHVLCFVCRSKLCSNSCPICFIPLGYNRCFALEQMIDAVKVPCSNAFFGCDEHITCYQKEEHEKACVHAPCFCPEDGCQFEGSPGSLLSHLVSKHGWSPTSFHYGKPDQISIPRHRRFVLLVAAEDGSLFLMVNAPASAGAHAGNGSALAMVCVRSRESGACYSSRISAIRRTEADGERYLFQMDPHVASSSLRGGVQLGRFFLVVPPDLVDEATDELTINIRIDKIRCAVHS